MSFAYRLDLASRPATRDSARTRAFSDSRLDSTREYATRKQTSLGSSSCYGGSACWQAFDSPVHPLGRLMSSLVDVYRVTYVGVGAHPRLLRHAVDDVVSYVRRIYPILRSVSVLLSSLSRSHPTNCSVGVARYLKSRRDTYRDT